MSTAIFEVPLNGQPQTLQITLSNIVYQLTVQWRNSAGWVLDIATQTGVPIIHGIPLVTGADLLAQYRYLGILGSLVVSTDANPDAVPTYANLGTASHLYFAVKS
jgi:hypothetical protein